MVARLVGGGVLSVQGGQWRVDRRQGAVQHPVIQLQTAEGLAAPDDARATERVVLLVLRGGGLAAGSG